MGKTVTKQSNSGFSLVELVASIAIFGLLLLGTRQMLLRAQETSIRETLRKNHTDLSQDLLRRINYAYRRHVTKVLTPSRLNLSLPASTVVIETVCVNVDKPWQSPGALLNRCKPCPGQARQMIRIQSSAGTRIYPAGSQSPEMPAAASICFKNGADPTEVQMILEILAVDPVNHTEKKVSKLDTLLIKDLNNVSLFE